jgi:uncharacterized protein
MRRAKQAVRLEGDRAVAQVQTAQANREMIVAGYEAFGRGDLEAVRAMWTDDIEWVIPGRNPLAGTYRGPDAVMGFFAKLMDLSGGTFNLEVRDVTASDEHVVVLVKSSGERSGRKLQSSGAHVWQIRDGKACKFVGLEQDQYTDDDFWS